jgi:hypothetical protein
MLSKPVEQPRRRSAQMEGRTLCPSSAFILCTSCKEHIKNSETYVKNKTFLRPLYRREVAYLHDFNNTGHVARMGEMSNGYNILVGNLEGYSPHTRASVHEVFYLTEARDVFGSVLRLF